MILYDHLGGPLHYSGDALSQAHARLLLEQRHFDAGAVRLVETLRELAVTEDIVGHVAAAVTPLARQIVNTTGAQSSGAIE
jgi:truncated hemoglobin YjbI